jgi:hypothetical protein
MNRFFSLRRVAPALAALAILGFALPVSAHKPRPFRGHAEETITDETPVGPGLVGLIFEGKGKATHLGRFTSFETVLFDMGNGTLLGTRVFIAANGDRLYADVEGAFTSATTAEGTFTFTGGTGRFRNASGEADFEAVTPDGIEIELTFEGTIKY